MRWRIAVVVCAALALGGAAREEGGLAARVWGGGARYSVSSTLQLAAAAPAAAPGPAELQLRATLTVRPHWAAPPLLLLLLTVEDVSVWGRGAGARAAWGRRHTAPALAAPLSAALQLNASRLDALLLPPAEPAARNLLRSLASLFQVSEAPLEREETDAAGHCHVLYEPAPTGLRKEAEAEDLIESGARLSAAPPGQGGGADQARALLRAVRAARERPALMQRLLRRPAHLQHLTELSVICGAAGLGEGGALVSGEAPAAARRAYLAALAIAPHPHESAVASAARLADTAEDAAVRAAATLSAAAAASTLPRRQHGQPHALADKLAERLVARLAACAPDDDECAETLLLALANLKHPAAIKPALQAARRGSERVATAALAAVAGGAPEGSAEWARAGPAVRRLALLPGQPLAVRTAALHLHITRAAHAADRLGAMPLAIRLAAEQLRGAPAELRRSLWSLLRLLRSRPGPAAQLVQALPKHVYNWHELAAPGLSTVVRVDTGLGADVTATAAGAAGTVRHAQVHVAEQRGEHTSVQLALWTSGLHALQGDAQHQDVPHDEPVAAGLRLAVNGVHLPPHTLFTSQGELVGLVWAGAGSVPAAVVRAGWARCAEARVPLGAGAQWAALRWAGGAAGALDAHAAVSLWSRTAAAQVDLRAATAATAAATAAAWGNLTAQVTETNHGTLTVSADMDFYGEPALCVRAAVSGAGRAVHAVSLTRAGAWQVSRPRSVSLWPAPRSLALPPHLSAHCAALAAHSH